MKRHVSLFVLVSLGLAFAWASAAKAGKPYHHHQRSCAKCVIPRQNYGHDTPRFGATQFAVVDAALGDGNSRRRPGHFRATALTVDHLRLDQVGLAIYQAEGKLIATGRLTHNGGDGSLIGSNVTVRLRAYVAASAEPTEIPPDATVVWQAEQNLWIPRGRPQHISLLSPEQSLASAKALRGYFDQITHLEIELEYQRDP